MKVAIVGASLGGLAAANVFHQLGAKVRVFEKYAREFSERGGGLGFVDTGMWHELRGVPMMRRGRRASREQGAFFYGDLWKYLFAGLPEDAVTFGYEVSGLGEDTAKPTIDGEVFDLTVLADGGWSKLRHRYVTRSQPEYAGYVCWRGQVDAADVPGGFEDFGIYKNENFDTIVLPCCKDDGRDLLMGGVFIATPEDEVERPKDGASRHIGSEKEQLGSPVPDWFLPFYRSKFGAHASGELARLFEAFATKGLIRAHPQYDYAADKVSSGRVVLVGDAAHMASPRTAAGAHTAVLDALALREAFSAASDVDAALQSYGRGALQRAKELHMRSISVRQQFLPAAGMAAVESPAKLGRAAAAAACIG